MLPGSSARFTLVSQAKENDWGLRVIHSIHSISLPMEKHGYGCDRTVFMLFEDTIKVKLNELESWIRSSGKEGENSK